MSSSLAVTDQIRVAVVTGEHAFDVPGFHAIFRSFSGVDSYIQHMDDFVADTGGVKDQYDVVLFYNMHGQTPDEGSKAWKALGELSAGGQGIFLLHHAILAYPQWGVWSDLVGMHDRSFGYHHELEVHVDIKQADHPITRGLEAWDMVDETYTMGTPGADSEILLGIEHPLSMKAIAWTRTVDKARVFCFQSGHDNLTFVDPNFRTVILRGIEWCAGRV
jgi:type 1 glutamine amidotransferase